MNGFSEYSTYDAVGLANLVRKREVHPSELVEAALAAVDHTNPMLNAVVTRMDDEARRLSRESLPVGPLTGVPVALKDLLSMYAGVRHTGGSRLFANYVADRDVELVKRYKQAGLIIIGKTNTPELGILPTTEPLLFGPAHNPWNLNRSTGGSSGGSAAAVAAGIVPVADGSDAGGSIRIPASCCGIFGLKPTRGRNPGTEEIGEYHGLAVTHVLTRSVRDSAIFLDILSAERPGAPYQAPAPPQESFYGILKKPVRKLRIALMTEPILPGSVDADCTAATAQAARLCEQLGHDVETASPKLNAEAFARAMVNVYAVETATTMKVLLAQLGMTARIADLETPTWMLYLLGNSISAVDHALAVRTLHRIGAEVADFFSKYDVLLTPTLGSPPPLLGELNAPWYEDLMHRLVVRGKLKRILKWVNAVDLAARHVFDFAPFTPLANATGQPAMSVPLYWNKDRLPIGVMFTGRFGDESTLLQLATQLEMAQPWRSNTPPVHYSD